MKTRVSMLRSINAALVMGLFFNFAFQIGCDERASGPHPYSGSAPSSQSGSIPGPRLQEDGGTSGSGNSGGGALGGGAPGTGGSALTQIARENLVPGDPTWRLTHFAGLGELDAYALAMNVAPGQTLSVAVSANLKSTATWQVYRLGYYQGLRGRAMAKGGPVQVGPQPACPVQVSTGLIECHWSRTFDVAVALDWTPGIYLAKVTRADGKQSYAPFFVREPSAHRSVLAVIPVTTWAAYNDWGGMSLYDSDEPGLGHGEKVSFDRPFDRNHGAGDLLTYDVYLATWLEAQGLDVDYATTDELERDPSVLTAPTTQAILVSGHDEYWSKSIRDGMDAAVAQGTSVLLLGADAGYWQIRFESSSTGAPRRVVVGYKEFALQSDPVGPTSPLLTTRFRNPPLFRPENALWGVMFTNWNEFAFPMIVRNPDHWALAGTGLQAGDVLWRCAGYEVDTVASNPESPEGVEVLADAPTFGFNALLGRGQMVIREQGQAVVFAAGGIEFVRALSSEDAADPRAARIVANVLYRALGQPVPAGLVAFQPTRAATSSPPLSGTVVTVAGTPDVPGNDDGPPGTGKLTAPVAVAPLPGGRVAVTDIGTQQVRVAASDGTLSTLGGGSPWMDPAGMVADASGTLYVSEINGHDIRRINPDGTVDTLAGNRGAPGYADGPGAKAFFHSPAGLALSQGALYAADVMNGCIRRVDLKKLNHPVTTVAFGLYRPSAVAVAPDGTLYVVETGNSRLVAVKGGVVKVVAGGDDQGFADGPANSALFLPFLGLAMLPDGSLAVSDPGNYRLRRVAAGMVTTLAGTGAAGHQDGPAADATFLLPAGIAVDGTGGLYVADTGNGLVRRVRWP